MNKKLISKILLGSLIMPSLMLGNTATYATCSAPEIKNPGVETIRVSDLYSFALEGPKSLFLDSLFFIGNECEEELCVWLGEDDNFFNEYNKLIIPLSKLAKKAPAEEIKNIFLDDILLLTTSHDEDLNYLNKLVSNLKRYFPKLELLSDYSVDDPDEFTADTKEVFNVSGVKIISKKLNKLK